MIDAMFEQEVAPGEVVIEQVSLQGAESVSIVVSIFVHRLVELTNTICFLEYFPNQRGGKTVSFFILQGADGDFFYVVDEGVYHALIKTNENEPLLKVSS